MTVRQLLTSLVPILLALIFLFSITTAFAYYTQQADWQQTSVNWHRVLKLFDLRHENTLATWFSSVVFLTAGIGFVLLGWGHAQTYIISRFRRLSFQAIAVALFFLSADEVGSVHETIGSWFERKVIIWEGVHGMGFSWLLIFAPFALFAFGICIWQLSAVIKSLPEYQARWNATALLILACFLLPSVLGLEALQGYWILTKQGETFSTSLEEAFELLGIYSLFITTLIIARQYKL